MVIGTHGRLKTWVSKRLLDIDSVVILVFDEADEMLKADGFADDSVSALDHMGQWGRAQAARTLCSLERSMRCSRRTALRARRLGEPSL